MGSPECDIRVDVAWNNKTAGSSADRQAHDSDGAAWSIFPTETPCTSLSGTFALFFCASWKRAGPKRLLASARARIMLGWHGVTGWQLHTPALRPQYVNRLQAQPFVAHLYTGSDLAGFSKLQFAEFKFLTNGCLR